MTIPEVGVDVHHDILLGPSAQNLAEKVWITVWIRDGIFTYKRGA